MSTDAHAWSAAADPTRRVGHAVEFHPQIGSTNDWARAALAEEHGDGVAVVADLQTAGRGRRGRTWQSPAGVNLLVSVGLRPNVGPTQLGWLGFAAGLAARDAAAATVPAADLALRWPNDLVAADGRKVGGVLVETAVEEGAAPQAVIGIGLNVNWRRSIMPLEMAAIATSLADLGGADVDRIALLARLLDGLDREVRLLEAGISPMPRVREASALQGRTVEVETPDGRLRGTVTGFADDGALRLQTDDGERAIAVGEVVQVLQAPQEPAR